ncbi:sugar ABC transporter ATP-binding protein [Nocardioides sp. J54]|uniref:sugar ABC transporter ATP-binding protein n=1 Tax=Nocardioides sp. J54 TaxID=935866 RepID=UPI0004B8883A|nr:sugar ABC transporter ATP-binding protein [Nocardioides sp. J54]
MSSDLSARPAGPATAVAPDVPVLALRDVCKTFTGVRALKGVDLDIAPGEIHALVGANGSGKSTLIKTLAGYHLPDPGSHAELNGEPFVLGHRGAEGYERLRFVHQDLGLVLEMSAVENLALTAGFITTLGGRVDWKAQARRTREMLARLGVVDLDVDKPLSEATPVERTVVAIAAALTNWEADRGLLVLDEPTAVLPHTEVDRLLDIVREIRGLGASVLYVSHRLDEIFAIADRVTVLRDGLVSACQDLTGLDTQKLAELMVGDKVDASFRLERPEPVGAGTVLEVRGLASGALEDLAFSVRAGEVIGLAGLAGSGAETVPYVLAGARPAEAGEVRRGAGDWEPARQALEQAGFPLVPADRVGEAVVPNFSVAENLTLRVVRRFGTPLRWTSGKKEGSFVDDWIRRLEIKVSGPDDAITSLSGGNQQKVILGRCLASKPDLVILAEPTAGVDVGTRQAIYELVGELADNGLAVVVTSTDTTDLLALCSRVIVLRNGRVGSELRGPEVTEQSLLAAMEADQ